MSGDSTYLNHRLTAWVYSIGIVVGALALLALRIWFGYDWPFPVGTGLVVALVSLLQILSAEVIPGYPPDLRRQSIYSGVWGALAGVWLYTRLGHDVGLTALLSLALCVWPLSHLEVAKLEARLRKST